MAITLGSNIASLRGQRELAKTSAELGTVFQRLSSGQRINRASDDAAGLAIADSLNAQSRILSQGVRNLNDGLSLLSIADSAIENLSDIMIRLEELAEQAANGVYTNKQRKAMDDEAQALSKEFFRISKTTEFNGQRLLAGEFDAVNLQGGVGENAVLSAGVGGAIGTGSFSTNASFSAESTSTYGITFGDLNGDGILDMITSGTGGGTGRATIRLGLGNGTFGAATSYAMESTSSGDVALGDLNGDGVLDIVTEGNGGIGRATVRLGLGDGTFGGATSYAMGGNTTSGVALGDLNGDGILDLVTGGYSLGNGVTTIRLGRGDGTFGTATSYQQTEPASLDIVLGDMNGDGILDLATAGYGQLTVRFGDGSGAFGSGTGYSANSAQTTGITLGDLNGDGNLDLVTSGFDGFTGTAMVRMGTGNGVFSSTAQSLSMEATNSEAVTLGDFNGDGILDLATAGTGGGTGQATIRLGNGNGTFGAATSYSMESTSSRAVTSADLNGDGVLDLATGGTGGGTGRATARMGVTSSGVGPLLPFSLKTLANARQALPVFKRKREQLAEQRGEIGAFQSRIDVARNVLEVSSENFRAAESRIRDADIADESSRLVRLNILQQAASAILAQANQQPALALQLLGG